MQLSYWKHPARSDAKAERLYVNSLVGLPRNCKVWLERSGHDRAVFKTNSEEDLGIYGSIVDIETAVFSTLIADGIVAPGDRPGFSQLRDIAIATKRPAKSDPPTASALAPPTNRNDEAQQLDVTSINIDQPVRIQIDHREPKELAELIAAHPKVQVIYDEALPVGDIVIEDAIVIERKCCSRQGQSTDFESSIIDPDKRLFYQSERMKLDPERRGIVLLEGDVYANSTRMLIQAIDGAISFLTAIQGLSVWCTYNLKHTAYTIVKLAAHQKNGLGYDLGLRQKKHVDLLSQQRFLLEGLPGVNATLADRLLERFGTIQAVANASIEALLEVPGIGPKKAGQIHTVLNQSYGE